MANQNPQPEIYTTSHFFDATAEGATNTQTIFTQQANNEEVRIYGFGVDSPLPTSPLMIYLRFMKG